MKVLSPLLLGVITSAVRATPVEKRQVSDAQVLNYALTLEHLEATFYAEGLKNFTHQDFLDAGFPDPFYSNMQRVAKDEKTHAQFLTKALSAAGANPVEPCTYSFPVTDVKSFVTTGMVFEGVGVSAYTGAASKIANDKYLTAAASILGVEGRHASYFRAALGEVPFYAFDAPLTFDEIYTIVSPFIVSCPESNVALPVKAFPSLTATSSGQIMAGSTVTLKAGSKYQPTNDVYAAFITLTGPVWADVTADGNGMFTVTVPKGIWGQSYVVLTSGKKNVSDSTILAGPAILQVGPMVGTPSCPNSSGTAMSSGAMSTGSMPTGGYGGMTQTGSMPTGGYGGMTHSGSMPTGGYGGMTNSGSMPTGGYGGMTQTGAMPTGSMPTGGYGGMTQTGYMPSSSSSSVPPVITGAAARTVNSNVASSVLGVSLLVAVLAL